MGIAYRPTRPPQRLQDVPLNFAELNGWFMWGLEYIDWRDEQIIKKGPPAGVPKELWQRQIDSAHSYGMMQVISSNVLANPIFSIFLAPFCWWLCARSVRNAQKAALTPQAATRAKYALEHGQRTVRHKAGLRRNMELHIAKPDDNLFFADSQEDLQDLQEEEVSLLVELLEADNCAKVRGRLRWLLSLNEDERETKIQEAKAYKTYLKNAADYTSFDEFKNAMNFLAKNTPNVQPTTKEEAEDAWLNKMDKLGKLKEEE